jgi:hypothetical protein
MTLSDLASIGSLVSGLAVLVSLIYLAQQTRQNSKHTMALIQQGRALQTQNIWFQTAAEPGLSAVFERGVDADPTMDHNQYTQFYLWMGAVYFTWEDIFYQHRDGLVDDERHVGTLTQLKQNFQRPGFRAAWTMLRTNYGSDFQRFMDDLMSETKLEPGPNIGAILKSLAAAELSKANA